MDSHTDTPNQLWTAVLFALELMPGPLVVQIMLLAAAAILVPAAVLALIVNVITWIEAIRLELEDRSSAHTRMKGRNYGIAPTNPDAACCRSDSSDRPHCPGRPDRLCHGRR